MSQRSIEEVYKSIAPPRSRGDRSAEITAEFTSAGSDAGPALSQAAQEIAQLRAAWQSQADLIATNTQAIQNNTSAQGHSIASTVGHAASGFLGGLGGLLSPVFSGIAHLFGGGGSQAPTPLSTYTAPPPIAIDGTLRREISSATPASAPVSGPASNQTTYAPQITVHVNAMDSQSFMDRSADIASAVREAMLNNHPINGVVADL